MEGKWEAAKMAKGKKENEERGQGALVMCCIKQQSLVGVLGGSNNRRTKP